MVVFFLFRFLFLEYPLFLENGPVVGLPSAGRRDAGGRWRPLAEEQVTGLREGMVYNGE